MDKKRTIIGLLFTLPLIGGWLLFERHLHEAHPEWYAAQVAPDAAPIILPTTGLSTTGPTMGPTTTQESATTQAGTTQITGTQPVAIQALPSTVPSLDLKVSAAAKPSQLGSGTLDDANFSMLVNLTAQGAAIDGITLNQFRRGEDFKKALKDRGVYTFQGTYSGVGDRFAFARSMGSRFITVNGKTLDVSSAQWNLESTGTLKRAMAGAEQPVEGPSVTYSTTVWQGSSALLKLTKTFALFPRKSVTLGYELVVDYSVQNVSSSPVVVQSILNGPILPPAESTRPPDRQLVAGYKSVKDGTIGFKQYGPEMFSLGTPSLDISKGEEGGVVTWAGTSSVYFDAFVLFENPAVISRVTAEAKDIEETKGDVDTRPILMAIETTSVTLAPSESQVVPMVAYFGPRWRDVLNTPHYVAAPRAYSESLVIRTGMCAKCTFDWLINGLVWLLGAFHTVAGGFAGHGDWGIAIILLVALVRTCLHPITKRSQVQMMKMGKMGPALAKLKEKHADNKEAFSKAQMDLMKQQGFAPILGCLPMFLQMPIWMALWQALQSTFELRQASFLWDMTWIRDLSKPDYLIRFGETINLPFGLHLDGINLLPVLMSGIFYIQTSIQNNLQPATTPEQQQQKTMMKWMSTFLFPLFLYNGPSGLNLYILTSTLVGVIESKIIRDHIKQREAAEKASGPVVVDARPTRAARRAQAQDARGDDAPVVKTGLAGIMSRLQKRVEDLQNQGKDQERKKKPK